MPDTEVADQKTPVTGAGADATPKTTPPPAAAATPDPKAAATAEPDKGASVLADVTDDNGDMLGAGSDDGKGTPPSWPDDWRIKMAGGDEKLAKRLERFTDPSKVTQSWLAAEQKISSGEYKKTLPENATDEQKAEWRKLQGIPEAPDKYALPKIEGMEWGEADKPLLDKFLTKMHAKDAAQGHIDGALEAYAELVKEQTVARAEGDKAYRMEQEDKLRADLGNEFRSQINVYKRVLEDPQALPDGIGKVLATARDADGNRLINNAAIAKFIIQIGLDKYGDGAIMTGDARVSMESREAEIKQIMKTDFDRYRREGLDKEYTKILERKAGRRGASQDDD